MTAGTIIIHLNWLGNRQAVSVRPVGLSCVEAVKDWVASLRQSSEPFEIAGLKSILSGQTLWAEELPEQLGLGIPQHLLTPGADYEVIIGAPKPTRTASAPFAAMPAYDVQTTPAPHTLLDPSSRIYPVAHPFRTDGSVTSLGGSRGSSVYYVDDYGNRIPGPGPAYSGGPPSQDSTPRRSRVHDESMERLLAPKMDYSRDPDEGFDPNLRTVYRKMTPEDLDCFVYRMYAPYKHSAPRRDIYDEKKDMEKRMYNFREDIPSNKPPMDFRKDSPYEDDEDDYWPAKEPVRLSESEIEAAHQRLYEAARRQMERQKRTEESRIKVEAAVPITCSHKLTPDELKAMRERLTKPRKPPAPPAPEKVIGSTPVRRGELKKNIEKWSKPKAHSMQPEMPHACEKKKIKVDHQSYRKLMEKLMTPLEREREWRKTHPVVSGQKRMEEEKKNKDSQKKWRNVW